MSSNGTIYVFDAYGTLFDVHSAAARHCEEIGPNWNRLTEIWRTKQLEYTWTFALSGRHTSFWLLTEQSLDYAIAEIGGLREPIRDRLLESYQSLDCFDEVEEVLSKLKDRKTKLAVLSNGDAGMLEDAILASKLEGVFDAVLSVEQVGIFKPSKYVYQLACDHFDVEPKNILFQSSNRWDIAGASVFGFHTTWVNRNRKPDEYPQLPADYVVEDLKQFLNVTVQ